MPRCEIGGTEALRQQLRQAEAALRESEAELRRHDVEIRQLNDELERRVKNRTAELHAANIQLEEASKAKSRFLSSMSHELRTPLNAILGFSELLKGKRFGDLNEKQTQYVERVRESGKHLLDLINDLLDMAKIDAGAMDLQRVALPAAEIVEAVVALRWRSFSLSGLPSPFTSTLTLTWILRNLPFFLVLVGM